MGEQERLELIKLFMLAIAPEVVHHRLAMIRHRQLHLPLDEEGAPKHAEFAVESAQLTLELAMHLAAQYAELSEEISPPPH